MLCTADKYVHKIISISVKQSMQIIIVVNDVVTFTKGNVIFVVQLFDTKNPD